MKYIDDNTNIVQDATNQKTSRGLFWWSKLNRLEHQPKPLIE